MTFQPNHMEALLGFRLYPDSCQKRWGMVGMDSHHTQSLHGLSKTRFFIGGVCFKNLPTSACKLLYHLASGQRADRLFAPAHPTPRKGLTLESG